MYKVLLVDDEPGAIKSLKYLLDWQQYGYTIAAEAANGKQALERFREGSFSLVITDIKMPDMNGLELIAAIRELSEVPIVVMSGYSDFGFAKSAIAHGVKDYLLKPVEAEDLQRVLQSVAGELERVRALDQKLSHGIPAMKERLARAWANGHAGEQEIAERSRLFDVRIRQELGICCLLAEMDLEEWVNEGLTDAELQTKRFAARNVIEEVIGADGYVFEESDTRYGIIMFSGEKQLERSSVLTAAERVKEYTEKFAKVGITVGVGKLAYAMRQAADSYAEAKAMLDQQFFFGKRMVIAAERVRPMSKAVDTGNSWDWSDITDLVEGAKEGDPARLRELLEHKWSKLKLTHEQASASPQIAKSMILELFIELFRLVREQGADYEALFDPKRQDYERIMGARTLAELFDITWSKYREVSELLRSHRQRPSDSAIKTVQRLIHEKYSENISMKSIASQVYMNPAYLGQLFKAETGIGFNEYLFQVRMENAKRLLVSTDLKVYEVASAVGYNDLDWFYKKFKQYTGLNSSDYRTANTY